MELGYSDGKMYKKEMEASVHWRAPELHIEKAKVYASVSFGPRVSLAISLPKTKGLASLSMNARFDIAKFEFNAGQVQSTLLIYPSSQLTLTLRSTH
jgi:hypothetical protein